MTEDKIKKTGTPHDEFYRQSLSHNQVAHELFSSFLPKHILDLVDLTTLTPQKDTFSDPSIGNAAADAVFSVKFCDEDGYLVLLSEHQSTCDYFMALRLMKYMVLICDQHRVRFPGNRYLPPIYPMVYYTGKGKYTAPLDFFSLFKRPELARGFFTNPYQLIDLHRTADEELGKTMWLGAMMMVMKHAQDQNIVPVMLDIKPILNKIGEKDYLYIEVIFKYIINQADADEINKVIDIFQRVVQEEDKSKIMTIAERLIEQGQQQGIHEKAMEIAKKLLAGDMDINQVTSITGLDPEEVEQLARSPTQH